MKLVFIGFVLLGSSLLYGKDVPVNCEELPGRRLCQYFEDLTWLYAQGCTGNCTPLWQERLDTMGLLNEYYVENIINRSEIDDDLGALGQEAMLSICETSTIGSYSWMSALYRRTSDTIRNLWNVQRQSNVENPCRCRLQLIGRDPAVVLQAGSCESIGTE